MPRQRERTLCVSDRGRRRGSSVHDEIGNGRNLVLKYSDAPLAEPDSNQAICAERPAATGRRFGATSGLHAAPDGALTHRGQS